MDRLNKKQREAVTKLSTARLTAKLAKAGLEEKELETLTGEQLLDISRENSSSRQRCF